MPELVQKTLRLQEFCTNFQSKVVSLNLRPKILKRTDEVLSRCCATSHDANNVGCWEFRPCSSCQHNRLATCRRAVVLLRGQGHRQSVAGEHKQRSLPSCSVSGLLRDQTRWWIQGCQRLSRLEDDPCGRR